MKTSGVITRGYVSDCPMDFDIIDLTDAPELVDTCAA